MLKRWIYVLPAAWAVLQAQTGTAPPAYRVETVAGSLLAGDGGPATAAQIGPIQGIAADRAGNLYLSDTDNHRIRKIAANGTISTIAGTGTAGFSGDGGPATSAQLNMPYGLAVDLAGYVYIADLGNSRVRRVSPDGTIATYAGGGSGTSAGDGGPAVNAHLLGPRDVAVDAAGNLYIAEFSSHRVRRVAPDGTISTFAGTGVAGFRGDGSAAVNAQLAYPAGLALDRSGALYIADSQNERIRKVVNGVIVTAVGPTSEITLLTPVAVAVDLAGDIFVTDASNTVHEFSALGKWAVFAGTGAPHWSGDGGLATAATLAAPHDLTVDAAGNLDIADDVRVRQVDSSGHIHTIAGDAYQHAIGDGGQATAAQLAGPAAVALDAAGDLFIADTGTERVRMVKASGVISTLAGTGTAGFNSDGPAAAAELSSPFGVATDSLGNVLIADSYNHRIRKVTGSTIATFAGTGVSGTGPEGLPAAQTELRGPRGVCADRFGNVYIVDTSNHRVLRVPPSGTVVEAAGNGTPGDAGDGGPARLAELDQPGACAVDAAGNLFIADTFSHRIRKVGADGNIATVAGLGQPGNAGDEGPATTASLNAPRGVAVDGSGDVYIADTGNNRIRMVTPDGVIHGIAGGGAAGFAGDGGPASAALLNQPQGMVLDGAGNLYIADSGNNCVRRLVPAASQPVQVAPITLPQISAVNAASMAGGAVAPGEILTIFGSGIGPVTGVSGSFDSTGLLANIAAGAEVRFDGIPAPVFYAQSAQVNVQVPYTVAGNAATHVEAFYRGQSMGAVNLAVSTSAPALFASIVNQDGSINSQASPAPRGTVVTLYGTGEGLTTGPNVSGQPASAPYPQPRLAATLTIGGVVPQVLYLSSAPGMVGAIQIDAVVPGGFVPAGPAAVQLTVGSAASPILTMWVQ